MNKDSAKFRPLGEIAEIGLSSIDKKTTPGENPVRLCNYTDVYKNWAITVEMYSGLMCASASDREIERFRIRRGQVAITKDSETKDDIGISTYVADSIDDVVLGYHCALITPNENVIDGKYLNAFLHSRTAKKQLENQASGSGQRFTLTEDAIKSIQVLVPSDIAYQRRIGNLFSIIDRKIRTNNSIIFELEMMARVVFDYWFMQFDYPDSTGKPYRQNNGTMVWNDELEMEIPEGWVVESVDDSLSIQRGVSYESGDIESPDGMPMINLNSFNEGGGYKPKGIKYYSGSAGEDKRLQVGDLCMCVTQQTDIDLSGEKNVIGQVIMCPDLGRDDITFSMDVVRLDCEHDYQRSFYYQLFAQAHAHKYVALRANGTKIKHLNVEDALKMKYAKPPTEYFKKYDSVAAALFSEVNQLMNQNRELVSLRDFLLPLLTSGQITIESENAIE